MLVFGQEGYPLILFPTSNGRYYQNKDFGLIAAISHFIENGIVKVYCPDSMDEQSWYNYSIHPADRVKTHNAYENLILEDVIEFAKYETKKNKVALCGCSFGGYHSVNLGLRHPDKVSHIFSLGGTFDIKPFINGYYDDNCYFNSPFDFLPGLQDEWYLSRIRDMKIVLGTGDWDICLGDNLHLSNLLKEKGIEPWLDVRSNSGHDWPWWKEMLPHYLSVHFQ